ncbi:MAG TPA: TonB-dependent receptor [Caulobacteraceae bacterium]|jgi:outer membrane receptor protein involved in Fe transport
MKKHTLLMSCAIGSLVLSGQAARAAAAEAPAPAGTTANPAVLEEVVVTAQKRSENINTVGMAITANTGVQLKQKGVTSVADLVKIEPSLQFSQTQSGTPVFTLRGVGYFEQSLSASPAVSIYQDEVAYPYPVMSRGVLLDPERVEILKGPQGTLYGQNATGGLINFIAAKPTSTFSAGFDDSYSRFNDNLLSGFISGPMTSTLNARLSASLEEGGAWQKSDTRGDMLGNKDTQIGRLILDWKPTDKFKASLNLNAWDDHSETQAGQLEGFRLQAPQNVGAGSISNPASYHPAPVGSPAYNAYPAPVQAELAEPIAPHNAQAADWLAGTHPHNDEQFYQASLRLDYDISDAIGLTSLSNYEYFKEHNTVDQGGTSAPSETTLIRGDVTTYSQELRLHGLFNGGRGNWLVGANYETDKTAENDDVNPFVSTASYSPAALGLPPFLEFGAVGNDKTETKSVFANVEYHVLDNLDLHGGVRYTESNQTLSGCSYSTYPSVTILQNAVAGELAGLFGGTSVPGTPGQCVTLTPPPNFSPGNVFNKLDQSNVPWRVGLDWTPIDHTLLYFTVSKGYKAGSSPALGASQYTQLKPVTQEALLSYEVGAKSELFDRTLQLNVSYFHYDYTDKQELGRLLDPVYGAVQTLLNIPQSREDGVEFSAVWRPIHGLTLNAAVTYLDSEVTSSFFDFGPYPLGPTDLINFKGESFPFTPKWSVQYSARYDWTLWNEMTAFVSADASYQTKSSSAFGASEAVADDAPSLEIKPYGLLNLTAGVGSADHHWRVEVFGKNVTNTYYWNTVNYVSDTTVKLTGMPATYGVRLSYRY